MRFFSKIRAFLNAKNDIEDKIAEHQRKITHLEHSFLEIDEFVHKMARKRYAKDVTNVGPESTPDLLTELQTPEDQAIAPALPNMNPKKAELWSIARKSNPNLVRRAG